MKKYSLFLFLIIILVSCQTKQKFDKEKWDEVADLMTFPNRKYMINDLATNYKLKGKSYNQIVHLLGQPQSKTDNEQQIFYDIDVDYGSDIDPVYSKVLIIQFRRDSIVENFEVKEFRK